MAPRLGGSVADGAARSDLIQYPMRPTVGRTQSQCAHSDHALWKMSEIAVVNVIKCYLLPHRRARF